MGELTRNELRELLGAYALDAVSDDERRQVEQLLADDPDARTEVDEFREVAAALVEDVDAPPSLWARIAADIDEDARAAHAAEVVDLSARARTPKRARTWGIAAAAAAIAAVVTFGAVQLSGNGDSAPSASPEGIVQAAKDARDTPGAKVAQLKTSAGAHEADVIYLPNGDAWFETHGLADLPQDRTYQLWALVGDPQQPEVISAGVLGNEPGVWGFRFRGPVVGFVVTDEQAPGVVSSTNPAVLKGTFV